MEYHLQSPQQLKPICWTSLVHKKYFQRATEWLIPQTIFRSSSWETRKTSETVNRQIPLTKLSIWRPALVKTPTIRKWVRPTSFRGMQTLRIATLKTSEHLSWSQMIKSRTITFKSNIKTTIWVISYSAIKHLAVTTMRMKPNLVSKAPSLRNSISQAQSPGCPKILTHRC